MPADTRTASFAAVLWDFDGTLVDSEFSWYRAANRMMRELGDDWTLEDNEALIGANNVDACRVMLARAGHPEYDAFEYATRLNAYALADIEATGAPWRPGARALLDALRADGVPCALVSATFRTILDAFVARLPDGTFGTVVGGDMVERGKPAPDPYLLAARNLGVAASDCLAIEDSPNGAASAKASGAIVLGVQYLVPLDDPAIRVVTTLEGLDPAGLAAIYDERRRARC